MEIYGIIIIEKINNKKNEKIDNIKGYLKEIEKNSLSDINGYAKKLEDRIVKTGFRKNENPCTCPPDFPVCVCGNVSKGKVITRKPILPSDEEIEYNKRSKSSKLRVFERK